MTNLEWAHNNLERFISELDFDNLLHRRDSAQDGGLFYGFIISNEDNGRFCRVQMPGVNPSIVNAIFKIWIYGKPLMWLPAIDIAKKELQQ